MENITDKIIIARPFKDGLHIQLISNGYKGIPKGEVIQELKFYPKEDIINDRAVYEHPYIEKTANDAYKNTFYQGIHLTPSCDFDPKIGLAPFLVDIEAQKQDPETINSLTRLFTKEEV